MNSNFELALELLGVGMLTVFIILFLVVIIGSVIIKIVNRFMPDTPVLASKVDRAISAVIDSRKVSAIVAAVKAVTNGKGKVENIEKV